MLCTSRLDDAERPDQATPLQISTIADTWIHLSYDISAGERNRRLSIVKARGTGHSNQVREFLISKKGVIFKDVYSGDGDVLVGSQRRVKEQEDQQEALERVAAGSREGDRLTDLAKTLEDHIAVLQDELDKKRTQAADFMEKNAKQADDAEKKRIARIELRDD